jgi:hypothetical protein
VAHGRIMLLHPPKLRWTLSLQLHLREVDRPLIRGPRDSTKWCGDDFEVRRALRCGPREQGMKMTLEDWVMAAYMIFLLGVLFFALKLSDWR